MEKSSVMRKLRASCYFSTKKIHNVLKSVEMKLGMVGGQIESQSFGAISDLYFVQDSALILCCDSEKGRGEACLF